MAQQISIQNGVRVKDGSFQIAHPLNMHHKLVDSGESKGELVTTRGARQMGTGPGTDRGGINWNGTHYRVMGDQLVTVAQDGTVSSIGSVGSDGLPVGFALGFDRMGVRSATNAYYYDGTTLVQITDPDLGPSLDVTWIDSYFVSTDGNSVVVTELSDPTSIDPQKYGSAESDPDPITGVGVLNEDLAIFGRYTIQFHRNVGGAGYPFQNIRGALIPFGCISAQAKCRISSTMAFIGGARDEPLGVFLIDNGAAERVSDEEIDALLAAASSDINSIQLEARNFGDELHLIVHAGSVSAGLALKASARSGDYLWHRLSGRNGAYRPRNAVYVYDQYWVGDANSDGIGVLEKSLTAQFGEEPGWLFDAGMLYDQGEALVLGEIEIAGQFPTAPTALFFSMTRDGETWSREVARHTTGRRDERQVWRPRVRCGPMAGLRFRGFGKASVARCNAVIEPLGA